MSLFANTLIVKQDGTGHFISIQEAINASVSGDSVLVYPGRYFERLDSNNKSITIASLYARTNDPDYIRQTIIDANQIGSCLRVTRGETVHLIGFILTNGGGSPTLNNNDYLGGGGVHVINGSDVTIKNCSIYNCVSTYGSAILNTISTVRLYNNSIFNCKSQFAGTILSYSAITTFDPVQLNSVYNNYSTRGMDISIQECPTPSDIYLDTLSVQLDEVDQYFIANTNSTPFNVYSQNSAFQTINHDLYVSPEGDDQNDGLSENSPLKSIAYAAQIIESDSLNPKKIYLMPGLYSRSLNQISLPFEIKSHTALIGDSPENTIIDLEQREGFFVSMYRKENVGIKNISIKNNISHTGCSVIHIFRSNQVNIKNVKISHSISSTATGIGAYFTDNLVLEDIHINNNQTFDGTCAGISIENYDEDYKSCFLNNIILDSLSTLGEGGYIACMYIVGIDAYLSNIIMSNSVATYKGVFHYHNVTNDFSVGLTFSNGLIFNNTSLSNYIPGVLMTFGNKYNDPQLMNVNNLTVANNAVEDFCILAYGYVWMRNMLLYNPEANYELFTSWSPEYPNFYSHLDIDYSLIKGAYDGVAQYLGTTLNYGTHNLNLNPMFMGDDPNSYSPPNIPRYYYLSENSPCINRGTPDTLGLNIYPVDLAGNERVWNDRIDMGCFEYGSIPASTDEPLPLDPIRLRLYPNPVRLNNTRQAYCMFEFTVPYRVKKKAEIEIFNIKGQKVKTLETCNNLSSMSDNSGLKSPLIDEKYESNAYSMIWNLTSDHNKPLSSGVYIYRLIIDGVAVKSSKLTIIK